MRYFLKSRNDKLMAIIANANGSREMSQSKWKPPFRAGSDVSVLGMEAACSPLKLRYRVIRRRYRPEEKR